MPGITQPFEIVRTNTDVPHIFGKTDADSYFGLGFAQAQDRLWQMTMLRRTVQGRLSELFGSRTLKTDELMRRLDLYGLAVQSVAAQDDQTKAALEAYSRGVNAWIDIVNKKALGRGAPEFFLFQPQIATWTPADSVAILKLMALQLSSHLESEVLRARVSLIMPDARVQDILPDAPGDAVAALPRYSSLFPGVGPSFAGLNLDKDPLSPFAAHDMGGASNAWAAGPSRSAAGGSLLANDPHLGFSAPTIWYLARLQLQSGGVIGASIPGTPLILLGRSDKLGWGLTSSYLDDEDVHIEKLNPDNPSQYLTPGGWKPFVTRQTIVQVKGAAPVTLTLRWTENGPVLPGSLYNLAAITPPGHVTSLSWTALSPNDTSMTAGVHLMGAQSVDEALEGGVLVRGAVAEPDAGGQERDRDAAGGRDAEAGCAQHDAGADAQSGLAAREPLARDVPLFRQSALREPGRRDIGQYQQQDWWISRSRPMCPSTGAIRSGSSAGSP